MLYTDDSRLTLLILTPTTPKISRKAKLSKQTCSLVPRPHPLRGGGGQGKGSGVYGHNPWARERNLSVPIRSQRSSKSRDYLPQEFRMTNHNAGLFLLCNLLNRPCSCFDQSEYRCPASRTNHTTRLHLQTKESVHILYRYSPDPFSLAEGGVWERD